ncbi:right-handed parallel beta-helix repeat-containing protein [Aliikangiella marina]|uniref:Right-handed parallel beta-helix repeat-containing protein n=1 Tax=Aliikangiella marina TaxID=1712262 RepID=A0A545T4P8_9GAMM|nr:right-handed parallel beta-helix repeat-containing protein [Aliikangiella marina]TQV72207.1 right-handed parallel beta-helix repeat-containing protein [Aliikangiella marina]
MSFKLFIALALSVLSTTAMACDVTVPSGGSITNAVNSLSTSGGKVCLQNGTYFISDFRLTKDNVHIQGQGRGQTTVYASGSRGISVRGKNATLSRFSLIGNGGTRASRTFGILSYDTSNVNIWTLDIEQFKISVGVNLSSQVKISNVWANHNGDPNNESAGGTSGSDPHIWISKSQFVDVKYGNYYGQADGYKPGGDGELAAYDSTFVNFDSTYVWNSGASGIYLVNCDNCSIRNTRVANADGWGLDVVGGSNNFSASGNIVDGARFSAVIFHEDVNGPGVFSNNQFWGSNNYSGVGNCPAINVRGNLTNVTLFGNTNYDSGPIACRRR